MKLIIVLSAFCIISVSALGQKINPVYDSILAKKLGADDYGMKSYILVILKTGSNKTEDKLVLDSLFAGHLKNIGRLADSGKLIVAGPLGKNANSYRGIFIFNLTSFEEVNALLLTDPAIMAKIFDVELYHWYGSAALTEYLETHKKIQKNKF